MAYTEADRRILVVGLAVVLCNDTVEGEEASSNYKRVRRSTYQLMFVSDSDHLSQPMTNDAESLQGSGQSQTFYNRSFPTLPYYRSSTVALRSEGAPAAGEDKVRVAAPEATYRLSAGRNS